MMGGGGGSPPGGLHCSFASLTHGTGVGVSDISYVTSMYVHVYCNIVFQIKFAAIGGVHTTESSMGTTVHVPSPRGVYV